MKTGGKRAYFATARITDIIEDPSKPDHFYALIEDFLPSDHAGPFKEADYYESRLRKDDGSANNGGRSEVTERRLLIPTRANERPQSKFLQYRREQGFKGGGSGNNFRSPTLDQSLGCVSVCR